jgi:competence protein ComEC
VTRHTLQAGDRLDLGRGLSLHVLHPSPGGVTGTQSAANDNSLVLRLQWGEAAFLLTGDIGAAVEGQLLRSGQPLSAQVLKVAHHGSDGSSTPAFLAAVAPRYAIISVGADNRFGHPQDGTLQRLVAQGATVLRTDEQGTIEFITDGRRLWVGTER